MRSLALLGVLALCVGAQLGLQFSQWAYPLDSNELESAYVQAVAKVVHDRPLYSPLEAADSTIYHPGAPIAAASVLQALRLPVSVASLRILNAVVDGLALFLLLRCAAAAFRSLRPNARRSSRLLVALGVAFWHVRLSIVGYAHVNSSLALAHAFGLWALFASRRSPSLRLLVLVPLAAAAAVFVKQQGVLFGLGLVLAAGVQAPSLGLRVGALAIGASAVLGPIATYRGLLGPSYWDWCLRVPMLQPKSPNLLLWEPVEPSVTLFLVLAAVAMTVPAWGLFRDRGLPRPSWWIALTGAFVGGLVACTKVGSGAASLQPAFDALSIFAVPALVEALSAASSPLRRSARAGWVATLAAAGWILFDDATSYASYWKRDDAVLAAMRSAQSLDDGSDSVLWLAHGGAAALATNRVQPSEHAIWELTNANRREALSPLVEAVGAGRFRVVIARDWSVDREARLRAALARHSVVAGGGAGARTYVLPPSEARGP
jgi:hypothetical protein